jgi:hypothetical protein
MPLSEVPSIQLSADGTKITLHIRITGFHPGTPIELSGYATQANGSIATFNQIVQAAQSCDGEEMFTVTDVPVNGKDGFKPGEPITVVTRATDAWISTLFNTQNDRQTWNSDSSLYHSAWVAPRQSPPYPSA